MMTQKRVETCCSNSTLSTKYKACLTDKDHFIDHCEYPAKHIEQLIFVMKIRCVFL